MIFSERTRQFVNKLRGVLLLVLLITAAPAAQIVRIPEVILLNATEENELRRADELVDHLVRTGRLRITSIVKDTLIPTRQHERFSQYHNGLKVYGPEVTRQSESGLTLSIFGQFYSNIEVETTPSLPLDTITSKVDSDIDSPLVDNNSQELVILKDRHGVFQLAYRLRIGSQIGPLIRFVDAHNGTTVRQYPGIHLNNNGLPCDTCRVGEGHGVKGDRKKISVNTLGGRFQTLDLLRPPQIATYDLKGDWERLINILNGTDALNAADFGQDADNHWTDGPIVDGHVSAGWTYDYLYNRFQRNGLDGKDGPIISVVHPVNRSDLYTVPDNIFSLFFVNAFYCGTCGPDGIVVFGEGLPDGFTLTSTGQTIDFFTTGIDIVSHELAHAITDNTSGLIYQNESGALNEAFSDIIGVSVEFFMAETNRHRDEIADYLLGEDVIKPNGVRSLADPLSLNNPDHYSVRYQGAADYGGVHINSTIASHAFYLAIEGGTNRTSGVSVTGVGSHNRSQIEQVFYRAFTMLMPADATFSVARKTTLQSARDMFGAGHAVGRAIGEAWTAVGIE